MENGIQKSLPSEVTFDASSRTISVNKCNPAKRQPSQGWTECSDDQYAKSYDIKIVGQVNDYAKTFKAINMHVDIKPQCSDFQLRFENSMLDSEFYILESAFGYQTTTKFDPQLVKGQANCPVTCSLRVNGAMVDDTNEHIAGFSSEDGSGAFTYDASLGPYDGKKVKMEVACVNPMNAFNIAATDFLVTYKNKNCNPVIH
jgi:hypothetical protein